MSGRVFWQITAAISGPRRETQALPKRLTRGSVEWLGYLVLAVFCNFRINELPAFDLDLQRIGPFDGYANATTEADSSGPSARKSPNGVEAKQESPEVADSSIGSSLSQSKITLLTTISKTNKENDGDMVSPSGSRGTTGGSSASRS